MTTFLFFLLGSEVFTAGVFSRACSLFGQALARCPSSPQEKQAPFWYLSCFFGSSKVHLPSEFCCLPLGVGDFGRAVVDFELLSLVVADWPDFVPVPVLLPRPF